MMTARRSLLGFFQVRRESLERIPKNTGRKKYRLLLDNISGSASGIRKFISREDDYHGYKRFC